MSRAYPCLKRRVIAVVAKDNRCWTGENSCSRKVARCPRKDMPTGEGWNLCREVCGQENHAEINALRKAGKNARGAVMYLVGHTYICDDCRKAAEAAGVRLLMVVPAK